MGCNCVQLPDIFGVQRRTVQIIFLAQLCAAVAKVLDSLGQARAVHEVPQHLENYLK